MANANKKWFLSLSQQQIFSALCTHEKVTGLLLQKSVKTFEIYMYFKLQHCIQLKKNEAGSFNGFQPFN